MGYNYQTVLVMARDFQVYEKGVPYSQAHAPCEDVNLQGHDLSDQFAQNPYPPSNDLAQNPYPPSNDFAQRGKPQRALISLSCYIEIIKDEFKKSPWAFYRDLHSGRIKLPIEVLLKGKKKYYYVEVSDPQIIEKALRMKKEEELLKMIEKKLVRIAIKVPMNMIQDVELISSPDRPSYERFHEFVKQSSEVNLRITTGSNHIPWVKKRIKMRKEDYQRILEIAKNNDLSVGKVILAFLRSYFTML